MKRTLLLMARALAVAGAATLPWHSGQVVAQSVPDIAADAASDVDVDAAADTTESSADVEADASGDAATDPSTESAVEADVDASVEGQADPAGDVEADVDSATTGQSALEATDPSVDADVEAGVNQYDPTQPNTADPRNPRDPRRGIGEAGVDAGVEGDVEANVSGGRGRAGRGEGRVDVRQGLDFGAAGDRGLAINAIERSSLFYDNGFRRGDIVTSYNGRPIRSEADFRRWVVFAPGQRIPVIVLRQGQPQTIYITYRQDRNGGYDRGPVARGGAYLGVSFDPRIGDAAVVRAVTPDSPAERAGVQPGDAIVALNGNAVSSPQDVVQMVASMRPGQRVDLELSRRTQVELGARPITAVQAAAEYGGDAAGPNYGPPSPPQPGIAEGEISGYTEGNADVARPGDADGNGRVLDGDGRDTRPERGRALRRGRR